VCDEKFESEQLKNPQDEVAKVETAKTKDSVAGAAADAMGARKRRGERGRASNQPRVYADKHGSERRVYHF